MKMKCHLNRDICWLFDSLPIPKYPVTKGMIIDISNCR